MAGRRPTPTAIKALNGNRGKRALNRNEPKFTGTPDCPPHLNKVAKDEWERISVELSAAGVLTNVDRAALAAYCAAYSRWVEAEKAIKKDGAVTVSPKGYQMQSPWVGIANTSLAMMHKYLVEFGATPSSRSRIHVANDNSGSGDAFEEFMKGIGADIDEFPHDDTADTEQLPEGEPA
jgi:P27 family predicted phage terminase small subunit